MVIVLNFTNVIFLQLYLDSLNSLRYSRFGVASRFILPLPHQCGRVPFNGKIRKVAPIRLENWFSSIHFHQASCCCREKNCQYIYSRKS